MLENQTFGRVLLIELHRTKILNAMDELMHLDCDSLADTVNQFIKQTPGFKGYCKWKSSYEL